MNWLLLLFLALGLFLAAADSNYDYYRLPTALRPQKYYLRILTHLENRKEFRFSGTVKILIEALENTNNITLHSSTLAIDESQTTLRQISGGEKKDNCVASTEVNTNHEFYIFKTCQQLLAGNIYELSVSFSAELQDQLKGYYRSSYVDPAHNETRWISITQFEPTSARLAFPCFDEPGYKAPFVITLGHHRKFTALSNMPVDRTSSHDTLPDYIWTEFQESLPMSTYLVVYSVNDFIHKLSSLNNKPLFRTWARPNAIDQCDFASEFGPKVLKYYEQLFGIGFPLPKMDQMAIPDFDARAMENWGLVTYTESSLLYSPEYTTLMGKKSIANTMAHELAHQWFGNLVTMKWWNDLWLNEGFATYVSSLCIESIHPEWRSVELDSHSNLLTFFKIDSLESSHPVSRPVELASQIFESFDEISYEKGSLVLRMMHLFLGEESFRSGLKSYLEKYSYKNADRDDLWDSLTQAAHKNFILPKDYEIKAIMDSWILQTGYPILHVTRDYSARTASFSQDRYLLNTNLSKTDRSECWWIPLSFTTQEEKDFNNTAPKAWMECSKTAKSLPKTLEDLPGPDQWVIFNTRLSSPYKVNYDARNWELLIATLNSDDFESIHVVNRAQLLSDVLYFAWTGEQGYDTALKVIGYLKRERELLPWRSVLDQLNIVSSLIQPTSNFGTFKRFISKLITPIYEHLDGINYTDTTSIRNQDELHLKLIVAAWACPIQVSDCVAQSLLYFSNWRSEANPDENNPVPLAARDTVYCTAIRRGSDEDWDFLWTRYLRSNVAAEKQTILRSLSCTQEVWLVQRYIERIFEGKGDIRKPDSVSTFKSIASSEVGFLLAKEYFMENIELISKFYHPQPETMSEILLTLSSQIYTRKDYNKFKDFVANSKDYLKNMDQAISQALETILTNVQWMSQKQIQFTRAIEKFL
ncbi:aminopeptidase Ey-like [Drosophila ficusphila]|uniref:aminopeptidase Ey-like n=1 Tax=Drosophila ficusphila TaxID=30025 RepID=UPI001C8A10FF|nr:aminopeptidase Ey-like [Drosophila ficusphila]